MVPFCEHQNSWNLRMFIENNRKIIGSLQLVTIWRNWESIENPVIHPKSKNLIVLDGFYWLQYPSPLSNVVCWKTLHFKKTSMRFPNETSMGNGRDLPRLTMMISHAIPWSAIEGTQSRLKDSDFLEGENIEGFIMASPWLQCGKTAGKKKLYSNHQKKLRILTHLTHAFPGSSPGDVFVPPLNGKVSNLCVV